MTMPVDLVTRRERLLDLLVRCEQCGQYWPRTIARSWGWLCVDDVLDIWVCNKCAEEYTGAAFALDGAPVV